MTLRSVLEDGSSTIMRVYVEDESIENSNLLDLDLGRVEARVDKLARALSMMPRDFFNNSSPKRIIIHLKSKGEYERIDDPSFMAHVDHLSIYDFDKLADGESGANNLYSALRLKYHPWQHPSIYNRRAMSAEVFDLNQSLRVSKDMPDFSRAVCCALPKR